MSSHRIPIENIYYLLCYAWEALEERDLVAVGQTESTELLDLFARVLDIGTKRLVRRGVDRGYLAHEEWTPRLRGRILFKEAVGAGAAVAELPCEFDELSHDVLHNQILKSTAWILCRSGRINRGTADSLYALCRRLDTVGTVALTDRVFRQVQLNRNNRFYGFLLDVCGLIHRHWLAQEGGSAGHFLDFLRDEHDMRRLFEKFILNFYAHEATAYKARAESIAWHWTPRDERSGDLLPTLLTDVSLTSAHRKIIVECKFVASAVKRHHRSEQDKLIRNHLFQLFAYLRNQPDSRFRDTCEGLLLYPTVGESVEATYQDGGHVIRVRSLNLNQYWTKIHHDLLELVA